MSDTVLNPLPNTAIVLRGVSIPLASDIGGAFIADCSRNKERLLSDQIISEKYGITLEALKEIGADPAVRLAVNAEHERRIQNGDAAREAAARLFTQAPEVLGKILNSESASPRHRIEAAKELRATANHGAEKTNADLDRVVVHINLSGDKLLIDSGPLKPNEARENLDAE
jgi:hypothetical protein